MPIYTGRRGRNKVDLEILSRANNSSIQLLLEELQNRVSALEYQGQRLLELQVTGGATTNLLVNSDFAFSTLNFTGAGSATELYKWCMGVNTGTPITTSSNSMWDSSFGYVATDSITAADDISQQFDRREILPGVTYFSTFLARKGGSGASADTRLKVGLWDTNLNDWITGSVNGAGGAAPTVAPVPGSGGSTTYKYRVVAVTDTGYTIVSDEATITNSFAVLNASNYNAISWTGFGGVIEYQVYRTSGTVSLIARLTSANTSYNDIGTNITSPTTVPTANPPKAVTEVPDFGGLVTTSWQVFRASIVVPAGYDVSASSAGNQFFRIQLFGSAPADLIYFDRIGLSTTPGGWQASANDLTATDDVSINPVGDDGAGSSGIYDGSYYGGYYY